MDAGLLRMDGLEAIGAIWGKNRSRTAMGFDEKSFKPREEKREWLYRSGI
jgi:hypothetical protein